MDKKCGCITDHASVDVVVFVPLLLKYKLRKLKKHVYLAEIEKKGNKNDYIH